MDENTPIVTYGPWNEDECAMFERRCPKCGRLVKADETSNVSEAAGTSLFLQREKKRTSGQCHLLLLRKSTHDVSGVDVC